MFVLVKEPVAPWPVEWDGVSATGEIVKNSLNLLMVRIGDEEFRKLFPTDGSDPPLNNRQMFDRLVRGWADVVDADKQPLAFSPENIALLLDYSGFPVAFGNAYCRYWLALPKAQAKNSDTPSAGQTAAAEPSAQPTTRKPSRKR